MGHTINSDEVKKLARMPGRDVYGSVLAEIGQEHPEVVVVGGDNLDSCRCLEFQKSFPERTFNVGIAEANMMGIAAGLAVSGKIPLVHNFAFLLSMRAVEQVRTDLCYPNLDVKLITAMFGFVAGTAGTSHHATEDIAIMRSLANMTVIEAADGFEVLKAAWAMLTIHGPVYLRVGRDTIPVYDEDYDFQIGRGVILREGNDATVIASGIMVSEAIKAADRLKGKGIGVRVINMHTVKPIDREMIMRATGSRVIVTAEDHSIIGGLGGAVAEVVAEAGLGIPVKRIGIKDTYCGIGPTWELREKHGLTSHEIMKAIETSLDL